MAISVKRSGALEYLVSDRLAVPHCFTTRFGGVSRGDLASLNLGVHRGDDPENVRKNYEILGKELGFDPQKAILTHQTHTSIVLRVGASDLTEPFTPLEPECDGLVTNEPGITLVVFTADCTPILLWDARTGAVGAAHAGWRGTASGIAQKTVEAMCREFGSDPADIRAAIGPNIAACCFETDSDVPEAMVAALGDEALPFIRRTGEKFHLDLKGINGLWLRRAGVTAIDYSTDCTACQPDRFWSHRVVGNRRGSQGALIVCKEETL